MISEHFRWYIPKLYTHNIFYSIMGQKCGRTYITNFYSSLYMEPTRLNLLVPKRTLNKIDNVIESGEYSTRSEFVRSAIRKELNHLGGVNAN
jgi:hypothetical protein